MQAYMVSATHVSTKRPSIQASTMHVAVRPVDILIVFASQRPDAYSARPVLLIVKRI